MNLPRKPISDDYAIIARLPGLASNRSILLAAGTTTIGTQAAVEYVSHPDTLEVLLRKLGSNRDKPFEAVLYVRVARGVPVHSELVAIHTISAQD